MTAPLILVTGANGYIASRLIPRLLEKGCRVRVLVRRFERLAGRAWRKDVEAMQGDVHRPETLSAACEGVHTAYYLIHSMASGGGYTRIELENARLFAAAAERAHVHHIIYLGGLADPQAKNLAPHMRSRIETGQELRQGTVPVTEFRAGVIVGPGSISFEMIRFLTESFPVLPGPNWLENKTQPIAAANVIDYLVAALDHTEARGSIYEMGGPDVMLYADTMLRYARLRGLKRRLFTLPGIPISLIARIVDWLTPVPYSIAVALVGGLQSDSIVLDESARKVFPEIDLIPYGEAVNDSLAELAPRRLVRVWEGLGRAAVRVKHEGFFVDYRRTEVNAAPEAMHRVITSFGAQDDWLYASWLWRLRGWVDKVLGGEIERSTAESAKYAKEEIQPGTLANRSRLRGSKNQGLREGKIIDYYQVEALEPNCMLLHSKLRAPGEGWMEWRVEGSVLMQTAFFAPRGLPGFLYWYLLSPFHRLVFRGLIQAIKKRSETQ
jgi:uncharacterized protein YbjT (DUF2867 family)